MTSLHQPCCILTTETQHSFIAYGLLKRMTTPFFRKGKLTYQQNWLRLGEAWIISLTSHNNVQQDLADRRMTHPMDPVIDHHTSQERQLTAVSIRTISLINQGNQPHQSGQSASSIRTISLINQDNQPHQSGQSASSIRAISLINQDNQPHQSGQSASSIRTISLINQGNQPHQLTKQSHAEDPTQKIQTSGGIDYCRRTGGLSSRMDHQRTDLQP